MGRKKKLVAKKSNESKGKNLLPSSSRLYERIVHKNTYTTNSYVIRETKQRLCARRREGGGRGSTQKGAGGETLVVAFRRRRRRTTLHARRKFYRVVPVNDFAGTISRSGTVAFVASIRPIRSVKSEKLPALGRRFQEPGV